MNKLFVGIMFVIIGICAEGSAEGRKRFSFNENWQFAKGDYKDAPKASFDDSGWRTLTLPHDWAIEGPFDEQHNARTGGLPVYGTAWYRKQFTVDKAHKGQKVTIEFDGVMDKSQVYVNGHLAGGRPFGYIGFEMDITPYINYDKENTIAVKVAPEKLSSRWYPGAGIYRNVWMEIKNPLHVAHWGTYVTTPIINEKQCITSFETTINNAYGESGTVTVETIIEDETGKQVANGVETINVSGEERIQIKQELSIDNPVLWDMEHPHRYKALSRIKMKGQIIDAYETYFGVRTIDYSADKGFLLNGRQVRFRGVCLHHDLGPLGTAVNYRATERQLEIMKAMGVNAIRTSHNPPSPEQLELCDKMGILVQVEAFDCWKEAKVENGYHKQWDEWHERDLRDMIKRDRNHPSVVMWSIGNEIVEQRRENGGEIAASLTAICHDEDPTRPVTAGFNAYPACVNNGLAEAIDIVGFNYKPTQYDHLLEQHPDWIVYGSETSSCVSSRGVYHLPIENYDTHASLQINSYDIISPPWAYPPDFEFYAQETMTRSLGEFVWTGFDYLGEPTPFNGRDNHTHGRWTGEWPSRSSYFGIVDLCGFPKDRFYFYQSVWTEEPMVHILPHWNWEDKGHDTIPVYCYTNCDEAELFLNGQSLGKKVMGVDKTTIPSEFNWWKKPQLTWGSPYRLSWNVRYEPGELKVLAYREGQVVAEKIIMTAGQPSRLELIPDRESISADGCDLSFISVKVLDKKGNFCPEADEQIHFKIDGPATIAAIGNGNAATTEPFQDNKRKAFNGLCMLIVKSEKGESGDVKIEAFAKGLKPGSVTIKTQRNN